MHGKSSTTTSISLLLLFFLLNPATACTNETAVNYDPSSSIPEDDCHGPTSSLAVIQQPPNITAGAPFEPAPVVELRDANGRRVVVHGGGLLVSASYTTIAYSVLTGAAFERTVTVEAAAVDGAANFSGALATITYASPTLRLGFAADDNGTALSAVSAAFAVGPAAAVGMLVARQPGGREACSPLGSQPRVMLKDVYNNTAPLPPSADGDAVTVALSIDDTIVVGDAVRLLDVAGAPALTGRTGVVAGKANDFGEYGIRVDGEGATARWIARSSLAPLGNPAGAGGGPSAAVLDASLSGERNAPFDGGQATFASLNVSLRGRGLTLTFGFNATAGAPPQRERFNAFAPVVSAPFDCHGAPSALELLPGWPPILQVVDAGGVRVTAVEGAPILAVLRFCALTCDESSPLYRDENGARRLVTDPPSAEYCYANGRCTFERAHNLVVRASEGLWTYTHATDPLGGPGALDAVWLFFRANVSGVELEYEKMGEAGASGPAGAGALAPLYVPELKVSRLTALNTGLQGGFGRGDSIEVVFNIRTDRAGWELGRVLSRRELDRFLGFSRGLGDAADAYSGVWRDDCTLTLIMGNVSGAPTPTTGLWHLWLRDDTFELFDARKLLRSGSTTMSRPLEGFFGAAEGGAGRLDPMRMAEDATAVRRWLPPLNRDPTVPIAGPMAWHPMPVVPYDPSWPRVSECDDPANPGIANKLERLPVDYGVVVDPLGLLQRRNGWGFYPTGRVDEDGNTFV